ncbi:hypothetical protein F0U61_09630 [Archangium violaceum]|uniref:hypothetical protein n=1 Tax=Archangium violaceum TaxID=83451 RepID=UPI002B2DBFA8|nr:hypothetical protein F0U61_09630 [Archangium violaceum]
MLMSRLRLLLVLASAGCAANAPSTHAGEAQARPKPAASPVPEEGLTPRQALAREVTASLPRTRVASQEAPFQGEVLAAGTPGVERRPNGVVIFTVPIGTASPVTCFFYPNPIDAGAAARSLFESLLEGVTLERVRATEVKAFRGSPALYLEGDFSQDGQVGRLKVMVHADPVLPKSCFHDEMGYAQTFLRVTESVATGLSSTAKEQPVEPYFSDVQVTRVGNQVLGFQSSALFGAKAGGTIFEGSTTLVRPGSPTELQFLDTNYWEQTDAEGMLVVKSYSKRVNDAVTAQVKLRREQDGSYAVEGQLADKDVQARLNGELLGEVGLAQRLRDGLLKGGEAVEAAMWVAPANPSAPTRVVFRPRTGAGPRAATMEAGSISVSVVLDAHGFVERMETPAGGATLMQERISQTGAP